MNDLLRMSDNLEMEIDEPAPAPAKKEKKPRKPLSDERKAALKENLKKGRQTALENRQKKALGKKIDKDEKDEELNQKIAKKILKVDSSRDDILFLKNELALVKEELKKAKTTPKPKPQTPPAPAKEEPIAEPIAEQPKPIVDPPPIVEPPAEPEDYHQARVPTPVPASPPPPKIVNIRTKNAHRYTGFL